MKLFLSLQLVLIFSLSLTICHAQSIENNYKNNFQISGKVSIGWYRPEIKFDSDTVSPILNHDKINNTFLRPEIEVRLPAGLALSLGYLYASTKPSQSKIADQIQAENPTLEVSENDNNFNSYHSAFSPGIGWRFQFVEKAFIQPHIHYILGKYASAEASYTLTNAQTLETTTTTFKKGLYDMSGISITLNIVTEHYDILGDGSGIWTGIALGWSKVNTTGNLATMNTDSFGTTSQTIRAFDKTWSSLSLGVSVGLLFNIEKKSSTPED